MELGEKEAVAVLPIGKPEAERLTAELKPFNELTVIVEGLEAPLCGALIGDEAERLKLGAGKVVAVASLEGLESPPSPVALTLYL